MAGGWDSSEAFKMPLRLGYTTVRTSRSRSVRAGLHFHPGGAGPPPAEEGTLGRQDRSLRPSVPGSGAGVADSRDLRAGGDPGEGREWTEREKGQN